MPEQVVNTFNRGEISPRALARTEVDKIQGACELMENFIPERLGPMSYRPGSEYIGKTDTFWATDYNRCLIPLTRSVGDSVLFEFAGSTMRPLIDGLPIACSTDTAAIPATSTWTGIGTPTLGGSTAILDSGDGVYETSPAITANDRQTLKFTLEMGAVRLMIGEGSTSYARDLVDMVLWAGESIVDFTPTTTQYTITVMSASEFIGDGRPRSYVECSPLTSGNIEFTCEDIDYREVSYDSSADVLFLPQGKDHHPKIIRRGVGNTFTFEDYRFINGPFDALNTTRVTVEQSSYAALVTITGSTPHFYNEEGRLIKIAQPSRIVEASFSAAGQTSDAVAVRGYGDDREIFVDVAGAASSDSVDLERFDFDTATWQKMRRYENDIHTSFIDSDDGAGVMYRAKSAVHASGNEKVTLSFFGQVMNGNGVVVSTLSSTSLFVNVHKNFMYAASEIDPTVHWAWGTWKEGKYPQGVAIHEGRLAWISENRVDLTVTDDYWNFDEELPGEDRAISRTIGSGATNSLSMISNAGSRLVVGSVDGLRDVVSDNYNEPLTYKNTNLKPKKGKGAASIKPVAFGDKLFYVGTDRRRVYEYDVREGGQPVDLMILHPTMCDSDIEQIAITHTPETYLWVLMANGELVVLVREPTEDVDGWCRLSTDGDFESIAVVPGTDRDELWTIVRRNGSSGIEKMSSFSAVEPCDSFIRFSNPASTTLTGLSHLANDTVRVWADGQDRGEFSVNGSGEAVVAGADGWSDVIVGLPYTAQYKSAKLANYVTRNVVGEMKTVSNTALIMSDYAPGAVQVGRDFSHLSNLPGSQSGAIVEDYDEMSFSFGGASDTNSRVCMEATGPCTIMALAYNVDAEEGDSNE